MNLIQSTCQNSGFLPAAIAALYQAGCRPRPDHTWSELSGLRYFGGAFEARPLLLPATISSTDKPCFLATAWISLRASFSKVRNCLVDLFPQSFEFIERHAAKIDLLSGHPVLHFIFGQITGLSSIKGNARRNKLKNCLYQQSRRKNLAISYLEKNA